MATETGDVADPGLAPAGRLRVEWARGQMPVLETVRERLARERPLDGLRIACCLHVTAETANLVLALKEGGAEVWLCASNPLSTQDDVAAYLLAEGVRVFARRGEDEETYYSHIRSCLASLPDLTVDDGADLTVTLHRERRDIIGRVLGGTEETTTGVQRLRRMEAEGVLGYPVVAVNDTPTKRLFDNRFGTGQSALDGLIRATNLLLAGKTVVVAGFGQCGRGVAERARGLGARVVVVEADPVRALEAAMSGYTVLSSIKAAEVGEVFITVTGNKGVFRKEHFERMRSGAVLANAGHFDVEIDVGALRKEARSSRRVRPMVEEFVMPDGRRLYLLAEGRLVNLAAAEGHPAAVMDLSFADQALALQWLAGEGRGLAPRIYPLPEELDREVARLKLESMGAEVEVLTPEQREYLSSWTLGT